MKQRNTKAMIPAQIPEKKRGRPRDYEEAKVNQTQRMTPTAHKFIEAHRDLIERMARKQHDVQWKLGL